MAINKVKKYFEKWNISEKIIEFSVSSATVPLAAKALNTDEDNIAKTLSFQLKDKVIVIVMSGKARVNNSKYKQYFHQKAKMLPVEQTEELLGHAAGGVCPFALNSGVDIYLDATLKNHKTVFPACGSSNSAIELSIDELEKYSHYSAWIDVCKYRNKD